MNLDFYSSRDFSFTVLSELSDDELRQIYFAMSPIYRDIIVGKSALDAVDEYVFSSNRQNVLSEMAVRFAQQL